MTATHYRPGNMTGRVVGCIKRFGGGAFGATHSGKPTGEEKMSTHFEPKDQMRIADILRKSKGSNLKAQQLAQTMATRITKADKALRRARAAEDVNEHTLAAIFYVRFGQLSR